MIDIIPDIHGQADKLFDALTRLGYRLRGGAWRHSDPQRTCLFLGDFIDRGPRNGDVIAAVRAMIDAGSARAIMGNHELNAIHYHTLHPGTGLPLRARSVKNMRQHRSFLDEFPLESAAAGEAIAWMHTLPVLYECAAFRAVHACWDAAKVGQLREATLGGVLTQEQFIAAADETDPLCAVIEVLTKGPEVVLPQGYSFADKDGARRDMVRVKWWDARADTWAKIAMSVPHPEDLPPGMLPSELRASTYPICDKPVFFGHYWLVGAPKLQAPNALCLDYSAGKEGPLVTYAMETGALDLARMTVHN